MDSDCEELNGEGFVNERGNARGREFVSRRDFLGFLPLLMTGSALAGSVSAPQEKPPSWRVSELFKTGEWERVKASSMAMDLPNYFGRGYSCAESILVVGLRRLKLPEADVWAAAGTDGLVPGHGDVWIGPIGEAVRLAAP